MTDTVKLIIEIPKVPTNYHERWVLAHGTPLDTVKAEIKSMEYHMIDCDVLVSQEEVLDIIEKYKAESEVKLND